MIANRGRINFQYQSLFNYCMQRKEPQYILLNVTKIIWNRHRTLEMGYLQCPHTPQYGQKIHLILQKKIIIIKVYLKFENVLLFTKHSCIKLNISYKPPAWINKDFWDYDSMYRNDSGHAVLQNFTQLFWRLHIVKLTNNKCHFVTNSTSIYLFI